MTTSPSKPKVLIVGAGLGGLTLAILLERAGIPYHVYERQTEFKVLGSAIGFWTNILPLFEQLGLLDKLIAISKESFVIDVFDGGDISKMGSIDVTDHKEMSGYQPLSMYRRDLHQFLLDEIPRDKISMSKKIVAIEQDQERVVIQCSDGQSHEGAILVGADGAYSGVRQSLHTLLQSEGKLSASDAAPLQVHHRSILGTTGPLDKAKFPKVHDKIAHTGIFIGENSTHTWRYFSVVNNRVAWRIDTQLDLTQADEAEARTVSEWDSEFRPDADLWRAYGTNLGGSMGDLIDLTDPETISKVLLEQKLFDTWYHGRTVLMGDACHKMLPNAGRGAMNAMMDAISLANAFYEMKDSSFKNVDQAFKEYYDERYPHAVQDLATSTQMAQVLAGQTWTDALARKVMLGYMPKWVLRKNTEKGLRYRPQVSFLPKVPERGTVAALPQRVSSRYEKESRRPVAV